jgi:hypothetical protein
VLVGSRVARSLGCRKKPMSGPDARYGADVRTFGNRSSLRQASLDRGPGDLLAQRNYEDAVSRELAEAHLQTRSFHDVTGASLRNQLNDTLDRHGNASFTLQMLEHSEQQGQRSASLLDCGVEQAFVFARHADTQGTPIPSWEGSLSAALDHGQQSVGFALSSVPGDPRIDSIRNGFLSNVNSALSPRRRLILSLSKQVSNLLINARRLQIADKFSWDVSTVWSDLVLEALARDSTADVFTVDLLTSAISASGTLAAARHVPKPSAAAAARDRNKTLTRTPPRRQQQQQRRQQQQQQQRRQPPQSRRDPSRSSTRRRSRSPSRDRRSGGGRERGRERGRDQPRGRARS